MLYRIKVWLLYLLPYYHINCLISACDNDVILSAKEKVYLFVTRV